MPDFLDRYGEQLRLAQQHAQVRRLRIVRRGTIASLIIVAIGAPALAVVQPWNPKLGRPKLGGKVAVDRSPVRPSAVEVLAVLRRPQTARDRQLAAPRLKNASSRMVGVQVDSIRALTANYALVPIKGYKDAPDDIGPMLCLFGGGGVSCGRDVDVSRHGVTSLKGGPGYGTKYAGVVPDDVVRVRFTPDGGDPVEVAVRENFYELRVQAHASSGSVHPPKGYKGPVRKGGTIAAPGGPVAGRLEWLDAGGTVIGPN